MKNKNILKQLVVFVIALSTLLIVGTALAQSDQSATKRPVYLDIRAVAREQHSSLSDDLIEAMARDGLSATGRPIVRLSAQTLPPDVYVLRILYVAHEQPGSDEFALAASASTQLLRTDDNDSDGVVQTYSLYSGLQQILVQGDDEQNASERMRDAFNRQLKARISAAFLNLSSS